MKQMLDPDDLVTMLIKAEAVADAQADQWSTLGDAIAASDRVGQGAAYRNVRIRVAALGNIPPVNVIDATGHPAYIAAYDAEKARLDAALAKIRTSNATPRSPR